MQTDTRRTGVYGICKSDCRWKAMSKVVVKFTSYTVLRLYRFQLPRWESCSSRELLSQSWCELSRGSLVLYSRPESTMGTVRCSTVSIYNCYRHLISLQKLCTVSLILILLEAERSSLSVTKAKAKVMRAENRANFTSKLGRSISVMTQEKKSRNYVSVHP